MARLLVHFSASRQLNTISSLSGEKTFALVNLLVTVQLLIVYSHRMRLHKPPNPVCWPFTLSFSHSCTLWTLDVLHIQSRFNPLNPTFPPSGCRKPAHLQSNSVSGVHGSGCKAFPSNTERLLSGSWGSEAFLPQPKVLWPWPISAQPGL